MVGKSPKPTKPHAQKQHTDAYTHPYSKKPPARNRNRPTYHSDWHDELDLQKRFADIDREVDLLEEAREQADDGLDWLPHDPSRPAAPANLWLQVYKPLTPIKSSDANAPANAALWIQCQENCGQPIYLNGKYQELNATGTPHGKLRKPPICHIVSWAVLKVVKEEHEQKVGRPLSDAFLKRYCWQVSNMRPGHNGCNAGGAKSTSMFYSTSEKQQAKQIFKTLQACWLGSIYAF